MLDKMNSNRKEKEKIEDFLKAWCCRSVLETMEDFFVLDPHAEGKEYFLRNLSPSGLAFQYRIIRLEILNKRWKKFYTNLQKSGLEEILFNIFRQLSLIYRMRVNYRTFDEYFSFVLDFSMIRGCSFIRNSVKNMKVKSIDEKPCIINGRSSSITLKFLIKILKEQETLFRKILRGKEKVDDFYSKFGFEKELKRHSINFEEMRFFLFCSYVDLWNIYQHTHRLRETYRRECNTYYLKALEEFKLIEDSETCNESFYDHKRLSFLFSRVRYLMSKKEKGETIADSFHCFVKNILKEKLSKSHLSTLPTLLSDVLFNYKLYKECIIMAKCAVYEDVDTRAEYYHIFETILKCHYQMGEWKSAIRFLKELYMRKKELKEMFDNKSMQFSKYGVCVIVGEMYAEKGSQVKSKSVWNHSIIVAEKEMIEQQEMEKLKVYVRKMCKELKFADITKEMKLKKKKKREEYRTCRDMPNDCPRDFLDPGWKTFLKRVVGGRRCGNDECKTDYVKKLMRCSRCNNEYYCSKECQKNCWKEHRNVCVEKTKRKKLIGGSENLDEEAKEAKRNRFRSFLEKCFNRFK